MNWRAIPCLALWAVVAPGCPAEVAGFPGAGGEPTDPDQGGGRGDEDDAANRAVDPYWCCDPDEPTCLCEGYWVCTEGVVGKTCRQDDPVLPDEGGTGEWRCAYTDDTIVCTGSAAEHPDAGDSGNWTCVEDAAAGTVECARDSNEDDFPESGGPWDCSFSDGGEVRACREGDGGGPDDGQWDCWTAADGSTTCVDRSPDQPDTGAWDCLRVDGRDVCQGDRFPEDGEATDWDCEQVAELVRCERADGQQPDGGQGVVWDCLWEDATVVCVDAGFGTGEGGDGAGCVCVVGARRICDEPVFCAFGEQTCIEQNGARRWGACTESTTPDGCQPGGAHSGDYQWEYGGGFWDTDEFRELDQDGDGVILSIPEWWFNPAGQDCALRRGHCVQDMWDLDRDGNNTESMGECEDIDACT